MNKRVAVIFLTFYDAPHYIDEAVLSLEESSYPKNKLTLLVVDNSEHGPSASYVKEHVLPKSGKDLPEVVFIENDDNVGFAKGNNQGIDWAIENDFDYVFLLNNDAKLHPKALEEAVKMVESDETIGAVQALMFLWKQPRLMNSSGNDLHFLGFGITRDYGRPISRISRGNGEEIGYASGAAVLYRVSALKEVGGLETFYWMYHEDVELGWRLRLAGWKSVLATEAIVYHDYSFSRSTQKMFWMERNRLLTHLTHLRLSTLLLLAPAMLFMEVMVLGGALIGGWLIKKLKSYVFLLSPFALVHILRTRRRIKRLRRISDKEATALFVGKIEHQEVANPLLTWIVNPLLNFYWNLVRHLIR